MGQKQSGSTAVAPPIPPPVGNASTGAPAAGILPSTPGAPDPSAMGAPHGAPPILPSMPMVGASPVAGLLSSIGAPSVGSQAPSPQPTMHAPMPPIVSPGNTPADQAMAANQRAAQDAVAQRQSHGGSGGGSDLTSALSSFSPEQLLALFA